MYLFSVISNRTAALSSDWLAALIQWTFPLGTVAQYNSIQNYKPRQLWGYFNDPPSCIG